MQFHDQSLRISQARTALLSVAPEWGMLALRLTDRESTDCDLMATDGTYLIYNPENIRELTNAEMIGTVAHEALHCGYLHPYRRGARNPRKWNRAADYVVNEQVKGAGLSLPSGVLYDLAISQGRSTEQVYEIIPDKPDDDEPGNGGDVRDDGTLGDGAGNGEPDPNGKPGDGGAPDPNHQTASDWTIATEQAIAFAEKFGKGTASAARGIREARRTATDWHEYTRQFIEHAVPSDFSWQSPDRRMIASGFYLPGIVCENMPRIGVAVDASGSVTDRMLSAMSDELNTIMADIRPAGIDVCYFDDGICGSESFDLDGAPVVLHPVGGGGTNFAPPIEYFENMPEPPACIIVLTDLYGPHGPESQIPVLWATAITSHKVAPWGQTVRCSLW